MKRIFKTILVVFLIAGMMLVSGCEKKKTELTTVKVSEVTHSIFYAPQYVAIAQGYFEEEGIKIELINGGGADKVMTALFSGDVDIAFCGPEQTVYVYNQAQADYAVNFAQLTKCDGSFILAREDAPDFTLEDLRGKHILAGRKGGMPAMTLAWILKENGIEPGVDCDFDTSVAFDALPGAFIGGMGDYVSLFEPVAGSLEREGNGVIVKSLGELSGEVPYTVYSAKKSFIEKNPELIQSFTNAIVKGLDFVQTHSAAEIAEVIKESFIDTDIETLTSVVERYKSIDAYAHSPLLTQESFERLQEILDANGELTKKVPYKDLVNTTFVKK